jgi:hypothetical protein
MALKRMTSSRYLAPLATLLVLGALGWQSALRPVPGDADPYHAAVSVKVQAIPFRIGDWVGTDTQIPREAQALLHPNALFARRYRNVRSGEVVTLVIVQCRSARDLRGHYPPTCYPANGYTQTNAWDFHHDIDGLRIDGRLYEFASSTAFTASNTLIYNFMLLPDGQVVPDMEAVGRAAADYLRHFFGAAQVQVVFASTVMAPQREAIFAEMVRAVRPVLDTILSGAAPHPKDGSNALAPAPAAPAPVPSP